MPQSGESDEKRSHTGAHVKGNTKSTPSISQSIPQVSDSAGVGESAQMEDSEQVDQTMVAEVVPTVSPDAGAEGQSKKRDSKSKGSGKESRKKKRESRSSKKKETTKEASSGKDSGSSRKRSERSSAEKSRVGRASAAQADGSQAASGRTVQVAPVQADPSFTASMRAVRDEEREVAGTRPAILFDDVTKVYDAQPDKPALSNVTVRIHAGEFVFLVGHSGSGKSTFIRLINRELVPTSGRIVIAGEDLTEMRSWRVPYLRRNIGCVFQDFKLLQKKTTFENVAFALEVIGKSKHIIKTQVPEVLRLVGLEDKMDKYPEQLSGGEQQRVSIARAIVNRPPLLICDEPTGNLDPQTSLGIMRLLDRINRTGTVVLVATHDREMVNSMRRRVITLEDGRVIRDQSKGVYGLDA